MEEMASLPKKNELTIFEETKITMRDPRLYLNLNSVTRTRFTIGCNFHIFRFFFIEYLTRNLKTVLRFGVIIYGR